MPNTRYVVGQRVTITAQVGTSSGVATDPLTINFYYKIGGNAAVTRTRPGTGSVGSITDGIEKTGTGEFKSSFVLTDEGTTYWRWETPDEVSATVIDAEQGSFNVDAATPASAY